MREHDAYHDRARHFFDEFRAGELLTTAAVLTEALHLLPVHLGPALLDPVRSPPWHVFDVGDGLARIGELMRKYLDRPMDFADASLVWVAEQTGVLEILPPIGTSKSTGHTLRAGSNRSIGKSGTRAVTGGALSSQRGAARAVVAQ